MCILIYTHENWLDIKYNWHFIYIYIYIYINIHTQTHATSVTICETYIKVALK